MENTRSHPPQTEQAWLPADQTPLPEVSEKDRAIAYQHLALDASWRRYLFSPQAGQAPQYWQVARDLRTEAFHERELGSQENPAHAFRIALTNLDSPTLRQLLPTCITICELFCQRHPDLFVGLKPKENGFCGFLVPNDSFSLQELLFLLHHLEAELRSFLDQAVDQVAASSASIKTLVCETAEKGIGIWDIPHAQWSGATSNLFVDSLGAVGLTTLATAVGEITAGQRHGDEVLFVTTSQTETLARLAESWGRNQKLYELGFAGTQRVRAEVVAELAEAQEVVHHSKKGDVVMYYRDCSPVYERLARDLGQRHQLELKLTAHQRQLAAIDAQLIPEAENMTLVNYFKPGTMLSYEQLNWLNPEWAQEYTDHPESAVNLVLPGNVGMCKIDVSGLTRLANESGVDPGKFVVELLMEYLKPLDSLFTKEEYLCTLDGDAISLIILDSASTQESVNQKITKLVELAQRSGSLWVEIVEQVTAKYPELASRIGEIDIKATACISTQSKTTFKTWGEDKIDGTDVVLSLLPGGKVNVDYPMMDLHLQQAETDASSGGFTMALMTDGPLSSEVLNQLQVLMLPEVDISQDHEYQVFHYPLELHLSVIESRMKLVIAKFAETYQPEASLFQEIFDRLNDIRVELISRDVASRDPGPYALRHTKNNWITNAKILVAYDILSEKSPEAAQVLWRYVEELRLLGVKENLGKLQKIYALLEKERDGFKDEATLSLEEIRIMATYKRFKDMYRKRFGI